MNTVFLLPTTLLTTYILLPIANLEDKTVAGCLRSLSICEEYLSKVLPGTTRRFVLLDYLFLMTQLPRDINFELIILRTLSTRSLFYTLFAKIAFIIYLASGQKHSIW